MDDLIVEADYFNTKPDGERFLCRIKDGAIMSWSRIGAERKAEFYECTEDGRRILTKSDLRAHDLSTFTPAEIDAIQAARIDKIKAAICSLDLGDPKFVTIEGLPDTRFVNQAVRAALSEDDDREKYEFVTAAEVRQAYALLHLDGLVPDIKPTKKSNKTKK